jgi:hypothetical protein
MTEAHVLDEKVAKCADRVGLNRADYGLELYKLDIISRLRDRFAGSLAPFATRGAVRRGLLAREAASAASAVCYNFYADRRPPPECDRIIHGMTPGDFTRMPFFSPKERMALRPVFTGL